jgi:hypothetical protein
MRQLAVLLWKDWRLLRPALVAMAVAGPACMFPMAFGLGGLSRWRAELGFAALMCSFAVVIVLTAPAFASERKTGTLRFLFTTAASRRSMFLSKAIVAGAASAAVIGAMALIATLLGGTSMSVFQERTAMPWAPMLCWAVVLFGSAAASRVEPVFALAAVAGMPVLFAPLLVYPFSLLTAEPWETKGYSAQSLAMFRAALQGAICLWVGWLAWRLFRRTGASPTPRDVVKEAGKAFLLLLASLIAPAIAACGALRARQAWRTAADISRVGHLTSLDAEGSNIAFTGQFPTLAFCALADRACVLDTATGEATLITRHTTSTLPSGQQLLSPDGHRLPFQLSDVSADCLDVVFPFLRARRTAFIPSRLAVYDLRTGMASMCLDEPIDVANFLHWNGDDPSVMAFSVGRPLMLATVRDGKLTLPIPPTGKEKPEWTHWYTDGGEYLHRKIEGPPARLELAVRAGASRAWRTCATRPLLRPEAIAKEGRWILGTREEPATEVELLDTRDSTSTLLWDGSDPALAYSDGGFSREGTVAWTRLSPAEDGDGQGDVLITHDLLTGRRGRFDLPRQLLDLEFPPDGAHVVYQTWQREGTRGPNNPSVSYVLTVATGERRALPVVGAHTWTTHNAGIYFTTGGAAIYHIRLDGTGLERVFPTKQALTVAEFEAEASR